MEQEKINEGIEQKSSVDEEILSLKKTLDEINEVKESWFTSKEEISKRISKLISNVKVLKEERNSATSEVKRLKEERDEINEKIKERISNLKKLNEEKSKLSPSAVSVKESPSKLREQIGALELKQETEVMSFDKEKSINKNIKLLKKKLDQCKGASGVLDRISQEEKELRKLKKQAEEKHRLLKEKARLSQEKHEELIEKSKEVDSLKIEEEKAFQEFSKNKEEFTKYNNELKDKLKVVNAHNAKKKQDFKLKKKKRDALNKELVEKQKKEVESKMKKGVKITTEDLLAFQN